LPHTLSVNQITVFTSQQNRLVMNGEQKQDTDSILNHTQHNTAIT